eukprot:5382679-Lingulodinium_polyedra.AAC.1
MASLVPHQPRRHGGAARGEGGHLHPPVHGGVAVQLEARPPVLGFQGAQRPARGLVGARCH